MIQIKKEVKKNTKMHIKSDLSWLGINWDKTFNQSDREKIYDKKIQELKNKKRIISLF